MKKFTKICSILAILGVLVPCTNVYATTNSVWSDGHSFEDDWEDYEEGSNWEMVYGYNTSWIDEDYTHTKHTTKSHKAGISNEDDSDYDSAKKGKWAKIEITHAGSIAMYGIIY